jgi:hypothetical protein
MFSSATGTAEIPSGLDAMPPGPGLAAILSSIDVAHLSGRDAVRFARATHRQIAHDQARQYRALSRIGDLYAGSGSDTDLYEFASAEVGAGLTLTRRTAEREMGMRST